MKKKTVTGIRDLAEIIGVSVTTVSRVLNGMAEKYRIVVSLRMNPSILWKKERHISLPLPQ